MRDAYREAKRTSQPAAEQLRLRFADQFSRYESSFDPEPGWLGIVRQAMEDSGQIDAVRKIGFSWSSFHEKYGQLRIDWTACTCLVSSAQRLCLRAMQTIVERAEEDSFHTCQVCGAPGKPDDHQGWLMTVCPIHAHQRPRLQDH